MFLIRDIFIYITSRNITIIENTNFYHFDNVYAVTVLQITNNNTMIFEINIKLLNCLDFLVFTLKNINFYNNTY